MTGQSPPYALSDDAADGADYHGEVVTPHKFVESEFGAACLRCGVTLTEHGGHPSQDAEIRCVRLSSRARREAIPAHLHDATCTHDPCRCRFGDLSDGGPPGHTQQDHHDASPCYDPFCTFQHPHGGPFPHPCDSGFIPADATPGCDWCGTCDWCQQLGRDDAATQVMDPDYQEFPHDE